MDLKNKVLNGLKWTAIAKGVTQLLSWISTFIVIRILTSEDYGIVALVSITFELVSILAINGFSSTIVKSQKKCEIQSSQVFTVSLCVNIVFCLVVSIFAENIAQFYNNEDLKIAIWVMAIFTPLNSLLIVPSAYLDMDMKFKVKAICESIAALVSTIVALSLALLGFEFWALIAASIVALTLKVITFMVATKGKFGITLNYKGSGELFKFAYKLQLNTLLWFGYNKLDSILIGRFLGISRLGIYNVGLEIAAIPMIKVSAMINQVGFSAFASLEENKSAANYYLHKSIFLMSLITFPIFLGISAVSNEIVVLLIGEKWIEAAPIIAIFTWIFPFRMINTVIQNYANGLNFAGFCLQNSLIVAIILIIAVSFGAQLGIKETAIAWVVGFLIAFFIILYRLNQKLSLSFHTLLCWWPPLIMSIVMWSCIYLFDRFFASNINIFSLLAMKIFIGVIVMSLLYFIFYRKEIKTFMKKG
jgi:O-antigen/teichoic acid export membrane protein